MDHVFNPSTQDCWEFEDCQGCIVSGQSELQCVILLEKQTDRQTDTYSHTNRRILDVLISFLSFFFFLRERQGSYFGFCVGAWKKVF